jgi:hypothetical protein
MMPTFDETTLSEADGLLVQITEVLEAYSAVFGHVLAGLQGLVEANEILERRFAELEARLRERIW